jgi:ADP-dependent NAD(P)H-hydrate dehydratase / NAD(P)H-hydrate epimerase
VMCTPITDEDGCFGAAAAPEIIAQAARASAVALGPGVGRSPVPTDAVLAVLDGLTQPLVVDADGLWHLSGHLDAVRGRGAPTVLTPHSGEAAHLLDVGRSDVDRDRLGAALELSRASGATVVLKGPGTIVCTPDGGVYVAQGGGPELSTAGSGDVLTGITAAALAKGLEPGLAAIAAVCAHAVAGARTGFADGTLAGDLIDALPGAMASARAVADEGRQ